MNSQDKADAIARVRAAAMYVKASTGDIEQKLERVLFEAGEMSAGEMIADYKRRMNTFDSMPLDPEGDIARLYLKQWSIFSGFTGTGKTTYLRQLVCHLLKLGKLVFAATLESDPEDYMVEVAATAAGSELPSEKQLQGFLDAYGEKLKIWGKADNNVSHKQLLATICDLADQGVQYAIIDSLMCLDIDAADIEAQRKFAGLLTATCIAKNIHIILVAHPKKKMTADQEPDTDAVAGSSNLGNLAWNVFFIRRGPANPGQDSVSAMKLMILKQRKRGRVGEIEGVFNRNLFQFQLSAASTQPTFYLPAETYPASGLTEDIPAHILNPGAFKVDRDEEPVMPWDL